MSYADSLFPLISSEEERDDYLEHYGVRGMKWGVRHDPKKAGRKSLKKLSKLDKKASDAEQSALKKESSAANMRYKAEYKKQYSRSRMGQRKAERYDKDATLMEADARVARAKANTAVDKAKKWASSMNKVFADVKISDVSREDRELGKKYLLDVLEKEKK